MHRITALIEKELSTMLDQDTVALIISGIQVDYVSSLYRSIANIMGRDNAKTVMRRLAKNLDKRSPQISDRIRKMIGEAT